VRHQVVTAANLDHYYPNDALLDVAKRPTRSA
jgi:hypothetical protein